MKTKLEQITEYLEEAGLTTRIKFGVHIISRELDISPNDVVGMLVEYSSSTWQCDDEYCCGNGWNEDL